MKNKQALKFNSQNEVFIIAEIGNNHEGDYSIAKEMVYLAASSGVNAVKFQTINPDNLVTCSDTNRINQLREFQLTNDQLNNLALYAKELDVIFFSTPFDIESAKFLNQIQEIFKIASGDNNFFPLIDQVFEFNKPTIISTGLADLQLLNIIYQRWKTLVKNPPLAFLHCVSSYPVPVKEANLGAIHSLKLNFPDLIIGYSDHTLGIEASSLAVAAGAKIIEKHFTLDKNYSQFRDHQLSADPKEMKDLVKLIRKYESIIGDGIKKPQSCEQSIGKAVRRSIAASKDIPSGKSVTINDITWLRPGTGIEIGNENLIIGKSAKYPIRKGELLSLDMFI